MESPQLLIRNLHNELLDVSAPQTEDALNDAMLRLITCIEDMPLDIDKNDMDVCRFELSGIASSLNVIVSIGAASLRAATVTRLTNMINADRDYSRLARDVVHHALTLLHESSNYSAVDQLFTALCCSHERFHFEFCELCGTACDLRCVIITRSGRRILSHDTDLHEIMHIAIDNHHTTADYHKSFFATDYVNHALDTNDIDLLRLIITYLQRQQYINRARRVTPDLEYTHNIIANYFDDAAFDEFDDVADMLDLVCMSSQRMFDGFTITVDGIVTIGTNCHISGCR